MQTFSFTPLTELMPHGMCFLWDPVLLGVHVMADAVIALAYFSIPLALVYFSNKGGTLPFKYLFGLFSAFIFACGLTHLLSIWTVWNPDYYLEGFVKVFTAGISLVTAIVLWPVVYKVLALPNLFVLQDVNRRLEQEIDRRRNIEEALLAQADDLKHTNEELEDLNRHLCGRELRMLELKQEVNRLSQSLGLPHPYLLDQPTI